jgi:hypothetical protein
MNKYDQMVKIKRIIESCKTLEQLHQTIPILERFRIMYAKSDYTSVLLCVKEMRKTWRAKSNQLTL